MIELQEGDELAGHRIEGVAGRGGMGIVYRARQLDLDRTVALKLIAPSLATDPTFRDRFIRESRVAASIDHPNVIPVYYAGESDDRLYIAMRYVEGDDLRTLVRREGRLDPARAAFIVSQVAAALDAAHASGIVHRDVKPANVLLGPGDHAYLTDFGLTKRAQSVSDATKPGGWVGTLGYVAPEQIRGERLDARADVYALGCILFHALTGHTPYARESDEATLWAHLNDPPPPLSREAPDAPPAFEDVIARALAKHPSDRYLSAGDLGRAALAAAGRPEAAAAPERLVARGDAAPVDAETVASPSRAPTVQASQALRERAERTRRPLGPLVAGAVALTAVAAAAIVLASGGGDGGSTGPRAATARRPAPPAAPVVKAFNLGIPRPNALAAAKGDVWVVSNQTTRVTRVSTATGKVRAASPRIDIGGSAITAGFGSAWVAKGNTQTVLRFGLADGQRQGPPIALPPGRAVAIATGERGVWVGSRSGFKNPTPQTLVKIDPATNAIAAILPLPNGVQNLAVGAGAVWVINRGRSTLTRIDVASGARRNVPAGRGAYAVAVGGGAVWVTSELEGTVRKISAAAPYAVQRRIPVGRAPQGLDVGGGSVWVANNLDGTLTRLDARTGDVVGAPVAVGTNPFAVAVRGHTAWVTLLGDGGIARVPF